VSSPASREASRRRFGRSPVHFRRPVREHPKGAGVAAKRVTRTGGPWGGVRAEVSLDLKKG